MLLTCWQRSVVLALLGVAWPVSSGALQSLSSTATSTAFIWSSLPDIIDNRPGHSSRTSYEVVPASIVLESFIRFPLQAQEPGVSRLFNSNILQESAPELVIVCSGPQMNAAQVARSGEEFKLLQNLMQKSASSLSLPYVAHTELNWAAGLEAAWEAQGIQKSVHRIGSCGEGSDALALSLPDASKEGTQVVLVCGPQDNVAASMELLSSVDKLVKDSGRSYAYVFVGQPSPQADAMHGRALLAEAGAERRLLDYPPNSACNAKCRSQVTILEGIILAVTLLSALCTGMCCMHLLGVPSRFELPKDAARQE